MTSQTDNVRPVSDSSLAIADFHDHAHEFARRAPDWGGDDLFTQPGPRRRFERTQFVAQDTAAQDEPVVLATTTAPRPPAAAPARRTVTITGRPEGARRPARTIDERIAHRPERIASWSCALGALSILLAIVTAQ